MYLIGIDFGHGETTASLYDTENNRGTVERLHILDGNTPESCKVESAVCRNKETGEWQFARDIREYALPDFTLHFKAPMNEITPKNKEAFAAFIKLVFEHILENRTDLHYNPVTDERNFELYAACPSCWDDSQIKEYKNFISDIIPIDWIIKESDAAYFKFNVEKKTDLKPNQNFSDFSVLVIDIGSSTIDFTAYDTNAPKPIPPYGEKHGASAVENLIYKYFDEYDANFKKAKQDAKVICASHNLNWHNAVVHHIKNAKEYFYTTKFDVCLLDLSNRSICYDVGSRIFDTYPLKKEQLEDEILVPYRKTLFQDLNAEKLCLENEQIGTPQVVILTGGASRMPWFQKLVKDVFSDSKVYRDCEPSYVVSDGIAYYAYAHYQLKPRVENVIAEFWAEYDDNKLAKLIWEQFNVSLRNKQLPKIRAICDKFDAGELRYNANDFKELGLPEYPEKNGNCCTAAFVPAMVEHNNRIINSVNGEISRDVNKSMNQQLKEALVKKLESAFRKALHGLVPNIMIKPEVNIDLKNVSIDSEWDINKIIEMTQTIYSDIIFSGNIYKDRTSVSERQRFSIPFYEEQKVVNVNLSPKLLGEAVQSLKDSILKELTVEKMVKKCAFERF
mgnify:CR=1 FL=1